MEESAKGRQEAAPAQEALRRLRPPVQLAEEVGASVGRGEILQRPLPDGERESARGLTKCQRSKAVARAGTRPILVWWLLASVHGEKCPQRRPATVTVHCPPE